MAKLVEMDEKISIREQLEENVGHIILINKFNVEPDKLDIFMKAWAEDASYFKQQSGFISAQLHKGIGKSSVFLNYAVWESTEDYNEPLTILTYPNFRIFQPAPYLLACSRRSQFPESVKSEPLFCLARYRLSGYL
jgi:quinol monooxygenase YgiN